MSYSNIPEEQLLDQKHKSTFALYEKPQYFQDSNLNLKQEQIDQHTRKTEGFQLSASKQIKRSSFYWKKASYLPEFEVRKLSTVDYIYEKYHQFPTKYEGNVFNYIYNNIMQLFSLLMQFFGKKFTILEQKYSKETIGTIFMFSACIIFIFPTLYLKCNKNVNISYALLVRGFSGIIGFTIMAAIKEKQLVKFCRQDVNILLIRGIVTGFSQYFFFYSLGKLPLSLNFIIQNTGPILVFIVGYFFFNGSFDKKDIIGITIASIGLVVVSNPNIIMQYIEDIDESVKANTQEFHYAEGIEKIIIVVLFLITNLGWAYGILLVKRVKEANTFAMNFWIAISYFGMGAIGCFYQGFGQEELDMYDQLRIFFYIGFVNFIGQYLFVTSTFLNLNHGRLTMIQYIQVAISYVVQAVFFNEIPSFAEILGATLVLLGVIRIIMD